VVTAGTTSAYRIVGSEEVFLCNACQIARRHQDFLKASVVCAALAVLSPVVIGLVEYPSLAPRPFAQALSAVGGALLSVPIARIFVGLLIVAGVGALARYAIHSFGDLLWIAVTWHRPYAGSGEDPDLDQTAEGEVCAIRLRRAALQRQGYDAFFTRKASRGLGRISCVAGIARAVWDLVVLFALFLLVLALIGLGSVLVGQTT